MIFKFFVMKIKFLSFLLLIVIFVSACKMPVNEREEKELQNVLNTDAELSALLQTKMTQNDSTFVSNVVDIEVVPLIKEFYALRRFFPVWTNNCTSNKYCIQAIDLLDSALYFGLNPKIYFTDSLKQKVAVLDSTTISENKVQLAYELEIQLTAIVLNFMNHLKNGVLKPSYDFLDIERNSLTADLPNFLNSAFVFPDFQDALLQVQPSSSYYKNLQNALVNYLKTTEINEKTYYISDFKVDSVKALKQAIVALYGLKYLQDSLEVDTSKIFTALRLFQKQHGIEVDGEIGKDTREELMISTSERYKQILVNLERLRWESAMPNYYVFVNIPAYTLYIIENDSLLKTFKVVTGRPTTATPQVTSEIRQIISYPVWNVPYSISSQEILPKAKNDSTYLQRNGYNIYDGNRNRINPNDVNWSELNSGNFNYRIQQEEGSGNALGTIKFIFPNKYHVYLHDTPSKRLFNNTIRAYSHGCMRVQNPIDFGRFLLEKESHIISGDSLQNLMNEKVTKTIRLTAPVPIFVRYFTCSTTDDGNVLFYKDIYDKDSTLKKILWQKLSFENSVSN